MNELNKINRIIDREFPEAHKEVLLVVDATTGQNAIAQASLFKETVGVTGIALTKLDGTAKGGVIIAVKAQLGIPIYFVGVGEQVDDLQPFNAREFASALFDN
jgi:fused signal recognition particle receptor